MTTELSIYSSMFTDKKLESGGMGGGVVTHCMSSQSTVPISMPCLLCRAHRELCIVLRPAVHKSRAHVAVTTTFCTLAHIIRGSSVGNLLLITHVTLLVPRIVTWLLNFWKNMCTPDPDTLGSSSCHQILENRIIMTYYSNTVRSASGFSHCTSERHRSEFSTQTNWQKRP
jgi:hypothetical protein